MDKRVIINCVIIILIWICNRMAYYYLSGNTSLIVSGITVSYTHLTLPTILLV